MKPLSFLSLIIITFYLITSCTQSEPAPSPTVSDNNSAQEQQATPKETEQPVEKIYYYTVVDKLRLRTEGSVKGEVVATLKEGETLEFTGNMTTHRDKIELRGEQYYEPWLEVITDEGEKGWIYGGGIRQLASLDGTMENEDKARRQKTLSQVKPSDAVVKGKRRYEITLTNGKKVMLKDVENADVAGAEEFEDLEYVGTFSDINYHLFDFYSIEYWEMVLVNGETGQRTSIIGYPILSKDKKRFGVFNGDLAAGFTANGVQILRLDGEDLIEEYNEERVYDLEPSRLKWIDNQTIELTLFEFNYDNGDMEISKTQKRTLTFKNGKWKLSE